MLSNKNSPNIAQNIITTLMLKNFRVDILVNRYEPDREPMVLNKKYILVAMPAVSRGIASFLHHYFRDGYVASDIDTYMAYNS